MRKENTIEKINNDNQGISSSCNSFKHHLWNIKAFVLLNVLTLIMAIVALMDIEAQSILGYELNIDIWARDFFTILLASVIGSVIGWERETRNRPAGLRTYALVCMGSALIMLTSFQIFYDYNTIANFDPARLGAQVISGIGFLGAGTIIRDKHSVKGLTTAASLWVVACIGLTVGARMYVVSIMITAVVYYVLHNLRCMDESKHEDMDYEIILKFAEEQGQLKEIYKLLHQYNIGIKDINVSWENNNIVEENNKYLTITIHLKLDEYVIDNLVLRLNTIEGVLSVYCSEI